MPVVDSQTWTDFLVDHPEAHILQTAAWGSLKSGFNWRPVYVVAGNAGAQILFRKLPLGLSLAYIPKGPVGADWAELWPEVDAVCQSSKAVFLKVEFDMWAAEGAGLENALPPGFHLSPHEIQPRRTIIVDLSGSEEQILARMKQKTRYNIRLARRKGVVVRQTGDIDLFFRLMQVTGERDAFGVHSLAYYRQAYELFEPRGQCTLLIAEFEEQPLAGLMVFAKGSRAWYFYGASANEQRHLMPTYLLQWQAMQWARAQDCLFYDLWGVPDEDEEILEARFLDYSDGLWGVYRFKRGFGGELKRSVPAWDRVYNPWLYRLYLWRMGGQTVNLQ